MLGLRAVMPDALPLTTRFTLGPTITPEQRAFLREHGFILFARAASSDEVAMLCDEMDRIEQEWIATGRKRVFGIPLFVGKDETGKLFLQQLAFTSVFPETVHAFVRDARFVPILDLIGEGARIGDREKEHDGRLWHRVARSQHVGHASLRRSMYLPYLTGPYEPKSEDSPTPASHRVGEWLRGRAA